LYSKIDYDIIPFVWQYEIVAITIYYKKRGLLMRKKIVLLFMMSLIGLTACGDKTSNVAQQNDVSEVETVVKESEESEVESTEATDVDYGDIVMYGKTERAECSLEGTYYETPVTDVVVEGDAPVYTLHGVNVGYLKSGATITIMEKFGPTAWYAFKNPIEGADEEYLYISNEYFDDTEIANQTAIYETGYYPDIFTTKAEPDGYDMEKIKAMDMSESQETYIANQLESWGYTRYRYGISADEYSEIVKEYGNDEDVLQEKIKERVDSIPQYDDWINSSVHLYFTERDECAQAVKEFMEKYDFDMFSVEYTNMDLDGKMDIRFGFRKQ
jgi:hypothetical protein